MTYHVQSQARGYNSRARADVECLEGIGSGSAIVDERLGGIDLHLYGVVLVQRLKGTSHLLGCLSLGFQGTDESPLLKVALGLLADLLPALKGLLAGNVLPVDQLDHHSSEISPACFLVSHFHSPLLTLIQVILSVYRRGICSLQSGGSEQGCKRGSVPWARKRLCRPALWIPNLRSRRGK